jgi:hypothetical protein
MLQTARDGSASKLRVALHEAKLVDADLLRHGAKVNRRESGRVGKPLLHGARNIGVLEVDSPAVGVVDDNNLLDAEEVVGNNDVREDTVDVTADIGDHDGLWRWVKSQSSSARRIVDRPNCR